MRRINILTYLLILLLCLAACTAPESADSSRFNANEPETAASTDPDCDSLSAIWRAPDEVFVYPFTENEIDSAVRVIEAKLAEFAKESGVLSYDVEGIAFDPMTTDNEVLNAYGASTAEEALEDGFSKRITFCVTYSAMYDSGVTFMEDVSHGKMEFTLVRESASEPWSYWSHGEPRSDYPAMLLLPEAWSDIDPGHGDIIAIYHDTDGSSQHWLFIRDSGTGLIRFTTQ